MLLSTRLLNHCERLFGHTKAVDRKTVNDALFVAPFKRANDHIQLELTAETFMLSKKPIAPFEMETQAKEPLPDIFPLKHTVSIPQVHFYKNQTAYRK